MMRAFRLYLGGLAALGGICAVVLAPAVEAAAGGPGAVGAVVRYAFMPFCHQDPARSIHLAGVCLPVCTRCAGIYLGAFLGWGLWWFMPAPGRDRPVTNRVLVLGFGPMVVDGIINLAGLCTSPGPVRFLTGLLFGATAARAVWPAAIEAAASITGPRESRLTPLAPLIPKGK